MEREKLAKCGDCKTCQNSCHVWGIRVLIDQKLCKGCDICLNVCPRGMFFESQELNRNGFRLRKVSPINKCLNCQLCELLCPDGAITVTDKITWTVEKESRLYFPKERGGWKIIKTLSPVIAFASGNEACARGAIDANCRFFAGYPITPSTEIAETMAKELPKRGGVFIQMEDELASVMALAGASWAGNKSMTATSGPGFSLMMEGISYLLMTETPTVIVDVQRAGPSTGQATKPGTYDIGQARWGHHGASPLIAVCPSSVQECYDLTVKAFNLSEEFRIPVIVLMDSYLGHLYESFKIPEEIEIFERVFKPERPPFGPTEDFSAPSMPCFEDGEHLIITGSTHDRWGVRSPQDSEIQENLVFHLQNKILARQPKDCEEIFLEDAKIVIVAYGSVARSAKRAIKLARKKGVRVGLFRPKILWPFPEEKIKALDKTCKLFVVPEMNQGILNHVLLESTGNPDKVISLAQPNGQIIDPRRILRYLLEGRW